MCAKVKLFIATPIYCFKIYVLIVAANACYAPLSDVYYLIEFIDYNFNMLCLLIVLAAGFDLD